MDGIEQQLGEALKREVARAYDSETFGEGALRAIKEIIPPERCGKLKDLEAWRLGEDLFCHIRVFNGRVLETAGIYGVRSDEYGHLISCTAPNVRVNVTPPPQGLKTKWEPEGVAAYLIQRLVYIGALPVPSTPIEDIIKDLGWEPELEDSGGGGEDSESGSSELDAVVKNFVAKTPGLRVAKPGEMELLISGDGKVKECVDLVTRYASDHLDELEDLIREVWYAGNFCFNDFLLNEERGGRAVLFAQVRKDLVKHGDSHVISMSIRSEEFRKCVLPLLLSIRNRCIGDA